MISIVIPVRNGAEIIGEQLVALAAQEHAGEWEVVVADNGSTDSTRAVVEGLRSRLPALQIVDASQRRGPAHARNTGAAAARGEIVAFVDADDRVEPGWLAAMDRAMADDSVGAAGGALIREIAGNPVGSENRALGDDLGQWSGFLPYAGSGNLAVRRSLFEELHGFDEDYLADEDVDFSWRLQLAGHRLVFAPGAVLTYRERSDIRGLFRQYYRYAHEHPRLYRRFRSEGMSRHGPKQVLKSWVSLCLRFVPSMTTYENRRRWVRRFANVSGSLAGSVKHRTWYLD